MQFKQTISISPENNVILKNPTIIYIIVRPDEFILEEEEDHISSLNPDEESSKK